MSYNPILDPINIAAFADTVAHNPSIVVKHAEAAFRKKIADVCDMVTCEHRHMILVTGPSASGKTTSAQRIGEELRARGKTVHTISLDNFYVDAANLPKWKDGYQNYESIEGLDLSHFEQKVSELLHTGHAAFPVFDFSTSARTMQTMEMTFDEQTYLIFEGIHALNPAISDCVKDYCSLKIYISVHSEFTDADGKILLSARDLRLMRRILRDFTHRDKTAERTFEMWDYVLMGEDLYIRPFRKYADLHIDSTHVYEPYLYHTGVLASLRDSSADSPYHEIIRRLQTAAEQFSPLSSALIPASSLIQEFIKP